MLSARPIGVLHVPGTGIQDNRAGNARTLSIGSGSITGRGVSPACHVRKIHAERKSPWCIGS